MGDTQFKKSFMLNKNKIATAIEKYSGAYSMNKHSVDKFINGQLSSIRRRAARDLIDNTIYITLKETSTIIETLILQLYDQIGQLGPEDNIYMFAGLPTNSYYFMSVLALFHIRNHGLKDPIFIDRLSYDLLEQIGTNPLIYVDDVSYSGSQMQQKLDKLYTTGHELNIYVLLVALNTSSLSILTTVRDKTGQSHPTPYKIRYLPDRLYSTLIESVGIERYFMIQLFFSPFTHPAVSIYLDHKMADEVSTFKKALSFGPIVPSSYNIKGILGYERQWSPLDTLPNDIQNRLYGEFNTAIISKEVANLKYKHRTFINEKQICSYYYVALIEPDLIEQNHIVFFPVIISCSSDAKLTNIISTPRIIHMDYGLFMAPKGCLHEVDDSKASFNPFDKGDVCPSGDEAQNYYEHVETPPKNIIRLNALISSIDCPISWYKTGIFMMAGTKRKHNKKRRTHKR